MAAVPIITELYGYGAKIALNIDRDRNLTIAVQDAAGNHLADISFNSILYSYVTFAALISDPTQLATSSKIYYKDGEWRSREPVSVAGSLATPAIFKTVYSGNFALNSSHLWERVITRHDGDGTLTITGALVASSKLIPKNAGGGLLDLTCATPGSASITGTWEMRGFAFKMSNLDLISPAAGLFQPCFSADSQFTDVKFDCLASTQNNPLAFFGGDVKIVAIQRQMDILLNETHGGFDQDGGKLKLAGNVTANRIVFKKRGTAGGFDPVIILDQSELLLAGVHVLALETDDATPITDPADAHGIGVLVRRGSIVHCQNEVIVQGFVRGFDLGEAGRGASEGNLTIAYNATGIRKNGAGASFSYLTASTTFTGNSADTQNINTVTVF